MIRRPDMQDHTEPVRRCDNIACRVVFSVLPKPAVHTKIIDSASRLLGQQPAVSLPLSIMIHPRAITNLRFRTSAPPRLQRANGSEVACCSVYCVRSLRTCISSTSLQASSPPLEARQWWHSRPSSHQHRIQARYGGRPGPFLRLQVSISPTVTYKYGIPQGNNTTDGPTRLQKHLNACYTCTTLYCGGHPTRGSVQARSC